MAAKRDSGIKTVCRNKKAGYNYHLSDFMEAGIVLLGAEVKSLREGRASLVDGYARVKGGEVFLYNTHITPYPFAHHIELNPMRTRKLLLNKREIKRLIGKTVEKGYSLIPTKIYFKGGRAKGKGGNRPGKRKEEI